MKTVLRVVVLSVGLFGILLVNGCSQKSDTSPQARSAPEKTAVAAEPIASSSVSASNAAAAIPAGKMVLNIKLPNAVFQGTPKNIKTPNLEAPHGPRGPFYVPVGTENVALKKKVTSSDKEPVIGSLDLITDGEKEAADGNFVELGPGTQWAQIDLGAAYNIYAIVIWHFHSEPRVYKDVVVQVADDPDFVTNVRTVFNNDHDNSSGLGIGKDYEYIETNEGKLVDAHGVAARYVRLYSRGNTSNEMNHYTEVEVFGKAP